MSRWRENGCIHIRTVLSDCLVLLQSWSVFQKELTDECMHQRHVQYKYMLMLAHFHFIQTEKLTFITPTFREGDEHAINWTFNVDFSCVIIVCNRSYILLPTNSQTWTEKENIQRKSMLLMCSEKVRATDNDCVSIKIDISFQVKTVFIYLYKYLYYIQNTYLFAMHTQKSHLQIYLKSLSKHKCCLLFP